VVGLRRYGRQLLVYLYYALDNRPAHFRLLLSLVTPLRLLLARLRNERLRYALAAAVALGVYRPLVGLGALLRWVGLETKVPLYEAVPRQELRRRSARRLRSVLHPDGAARVPAGD